MNRWWVYNQCSKSSNNQIVQSKACVTHMHLKTLLSLSRWAVSESQKYCSGQNLILIPHVYGDQISNWMNVIWKILFSLLGISYVTIDTSQVSIGRWKEATYFPLFPRTIKKCRSPYFEYTFWMWHKFTVNCLSNFIGDSSANSCFRKSQWVLGMWKFSVCSCSLYRCSMTHRVR